MQSAKVLRVEGRWAKWRGGQEGFCWVIHIFSVHFENTISKSYIKVSIDIKHCYIVLKCLAVFVILLEIHDFLLVSWNSSRVWYVWCIWQVLRFFFFPFNPTHLSWNFLYINFLHTYVPLIAVSSAKSQILNFPSFPAVMARGGVLSSLFCRGWNWMATIFLSWGESTQVFVT